MAYVSKRRRTKKSSKNTKIMISVFTALIMITGMMGFLSGGDDQAEITYGEYGFNQIQGMWITHIDEERVEFYSNPFDATRFNISNDAIADIKGAPGVYLTFDPDVRDVGYIDLLRLELSDDLMTKYGIIAISAVSEFDPNYPLPIIDCNNASAQVPVIYFKNAEKTDTSYFANCLALEAPSAQIHLLMKDRLMYGLYGIIE